MQSTELQELIDLLRERKEDQAISRKTTIGAFLISLAFLLTMWLGGLSSAYTKIEAGEKQDKVQDRNLLLHQSLDSHAEASRVAARMSERIGRVEERLTSLERHVYTRKPAENRSPNPTADRQWARFIPPPSEVVSIRLLGPSTQTAPGPMSSHVNHSR